MKKLLFILAIVFFSTTLFGQGYLWKGWKSSRTQPYNESSGVIEVIRTSPTQDSSIYTKEFDISRRDHVYNGLLGITTKCDTIVIDTTTSDTSWSTDARIDSILFILEQFVGVAWEIVDTLTWTMINNPDSTTTYIVLPTMHGASWKYQTTPNEGSITPEDQFPSNIYKMRMQFLDGLTDSSRFTNKSWFNYY